MDLNGKTSKKLLHIDHYSEKSLHRMGYTKRDGQWMKRSSSQRQVDSDSDSDIPAADLDDDEDDEEEADDDDDDDDDSDTSTPVIACRRASKIITNSSYANSVS